MPYILKPNLSSERTLIDTRRPRRYAIHSNAVRCNLDSERTRESIHRALGAVIGECRVMRSLPSDAGYEYQASRPAWNRIFGEVPGKIVGAVDVGGERAAPGLLRPGSQ